MTVLSEVAKIIDSLHSTPSYNIDGLPMVRVVDIKNSFIDLSNCLLVAEEDYNKHRKNHMPQLGDIVITRVGSFGMLGRVDSFQDFCLGQNIAIISPSLNDKYLYYYLQSPYMQKFIFGNSGGSAYKSLSLDKIRNLPYMEPEGSSAAAIGELLYAVDKKIYLNNKINTDLEMTARLIYNYWFTQFDFPDENDRPYKSSNGKMVYSTELKREIPAGWKVELLKDIIEFEKGTEPGSAAYLKKPACDKSIKFYRVGNIDSDSDVYVDTKVMDFKIVRPRDVIVTFDGSVGKVGIGLDGAISSGLRHIYDKSGEIDDSVIYFMFKDPRVNSEILKYSTGSVLMHASKSIDYLSLPVDKKILGNFQKIIKPMYDQIVNNKIEAKKLAELRDWLLPMLMSGQVKIDDMDSERMKSLL